MGDIKWWGYLHTEGTLQIKRYFDKQDLTEAAASPFVQRVSRVFEAKNREEAVAKISIDLGLTQ